MESPINTPNNSGFKVVWAFNEEYRSFFPALLIPSNCFDKLICYASSISSNNKNDGSPFLTCKSCGWLLGPTLHFHCNKHGNYFCARCFRLLKRSFLAPPKNPSKKLRGVSHDPQRRSFAVKLNLKKSIDLPISPEHLSSFSLVISGDPNPSDSLDISNLKNSIAKITKNIQKYAADDLKLVFWFHAPKFSSVPEENLLNFPENFSRFGNKNNQPELDQPQFGILRKAVSKALVVSGRTDVRCQDQPPQFNYEDCYDNVCLYCCEVGDLICCDGCTRVFHLGCSHLKEIPDGIWYCEYCESAPINEGVLSDLEYDLFSARFFKEDFLATHRLQAQIPQPTESDKNGHRYGLRSRKSKHKQIHKRQKRAENDETKHVSEPQNKEVSVTKLSAGCLKRLKDFSYLPEYTEFVLPEKSEETKEDKPEVKKLFVSMHEEGLISLGPCFLAPENAINNLCKSFHSQVATKQTRFLNTFDENKLVGCMDRFAREILIENSAINFFIDKKFFRNYSYLLEIPEKFRLPEVDGETGEEGYSVSFKELGMYRPKFAEERDEWHIWAIDQIPLGKTQKFLSEQKRFLSDNPSVSEFLKTDKEQKVKADAEIIKKRKGVEECSEARNSQRGALSVVKRVKTGEEINNDLSEVSKAEEKPNNILKPEKYPKSRVKTRPVKRNIRKTVIKQVEDLEKDNFLLETVLSVYSKERYGNLMRQKALETKSRDLDKKLCELKLRNSRKDVEISENYKQLLFYQKEVSSSKREAKNFLNREENSKLLKIFGENQFRKSPGNVLRRGGVFGKTGRRFHLKETQICREHRDQMKVNRVFDNRRVIKAKEEFGLKYENGMLLRGIKWADNDFLTNGFSWEVCGEIPERVEEVNLDK